MKTIFTTICSLNTRYLLVFVAFFAFFACKNGNENKQNTAQTKPYKPQPMPRTAAQDSLEREADEAKFDFQTVNGKLQLTWAMLSKTAFRRQYIDSLAAYASIPYFPLALKKIEGQAVRMRGFVIPVEETGDEKVLVLSANPYSSCFFCGNAGPESIMDIKLRDPKSGKRFNRDNQVTFSGTLRLNATDFNFFNYILEDAVAMD
jgi:hypothetical protein